MFYLLFSVFCMTSPALAGNPVELGDVQWHRSLEKAQRISKQSGKPILILFQEVPGCATCRSYGNDVLSDPLIVEAIETYFIPLAIYNNRKGPDAEVLQRFGEPAWNNPVVRTVNRDLEAILPRLSGNYSRAGLADYMTRSLIKVSGLAPGWLHLVADEWNVPDARRRTALYAMFCFWSGEAHFGKLNGVLTTEPGFVNGREAVRIIYDSSILSKKQLDAYAAEASCGLVARNAVFKPDRTPQYYLSKSPYAVVEMTPLQKSRVNSALAEGQDPAAFLSPRQLEQAGHK